MYLKFSFSFFANFLIFLPFFFYSPSKKQSILFYIFCGLVLLFLITPIFVVIPISFSSATYLEFPPSGYSLKWYKSFFGKEMWMTSLFNSIKIGAMTSLLACSLAIPAALALTRQKFKAASLIYSFLISPMIIPVIFEI